MFATIRLRAVHRHSVSEVSAPLATQAPLTSYRAREVLMQLRVKDAASVLADGLGVIFGEPGVAVVIEPVHERSSGSASRASRSFAPL